MENLIQQINMLRTGMNTMIDHYMNGRYDPSVVCLFFQMQVAIMLDLEEQAGIESNDPRLLPDPLERKVA